MRVRCSAVRERQKAVCSFGSVMALKRVTSSLAFVSPREVTGGHGKRLRTGRAVTLSGDALGGLGFGLELLDFGGERGELFLRLGEFFSGVRGGSQRLLRGGEIAGELVALLGQLTVGEREGFLVLGECGDLCAQIAGLFCRFAQERGAGGGVGFQLLDPCEGVFELLVDGFHLCLSIPVNRHAGSASSSARHRSPARLRT